MCSKDGEAPAPKIDLEGVVSEIVSILHRYRSDELNGDRYAAGWVRQAFDRHEIRYRDSEIDKSRAYVEARPLFATARIELLDHQQLARELRLLESRPRAGGKITIDHPRGQT